MDGRVLYKANVTLFGDVQHPARGRADRPARGAVREPPQRSGQGPARRWGQASRARDRRRRRAAGQGLVQAAHAIEARRRDLAAAFQAEHGRPPTDGEAVTLAEKAWDQTRQAKHAPRAEADQRAAWLAEAAAILGSEHAVRDMVEACLGHRRTLRTSPTEWVTETAQRVVERVAEDRATWQVWHLRAEAQRQARAHGIRLADLDTAVDRVVAAAIADHSIAFSDPDPLTRADHGGRARER